MQLFPLVNETVLSTTLLKFLHEMVYEVGTFVTSISTINSSEVASTPKEVAATEVPQN